MPTEVTSQARPDITYRLRDFHRLNGSPLWAWDSTSPDAGVCTTQSVSKQTINGDERLILCVEGPPCSIWTLAVTRYAPNNGALPPGPAQTVDFQLCAGQGRAASLLTHVQWSPNDYLTSGEQSWIFQEQRRQATSWWLFATVTPAISVPVECQIEVKFTLARGTPNALVTPQVGPNVVVIP